MSRAQRLLDLLALLRRQRVPVSGARLAGELGVSLRTLYRDIGTLQEQGAIIDSEPGRGYVLRPGFMLPPLMFLEDEIEALVLGSRWVAQRGDERLSAAAHSALSKIAAVLPDRLRDLLDDTALLIPPGATILGGETEVRLRKAIRDERKIAIDYVGSTGEQSTRTIWPFAIGYFERVRVVLAWCELRHGFRHFRTDRITLLHPPGARYPRRRTTLLDEWRVAEGISPPS